MKRFILSPEAERDLDDIWEYIALDNIDAADHTAELLRDGCRLLGQNPRIGHKREDLTGDRPVLFWSVGSYLIIYHSERRPIEIVAVVHGSRDIPAFLRRRMP
jgi:plasmid stabilization system protein ParE